ncbi:MAG: ferritin-like domain-containing protein [Pseudomonadota bacterium]
MRTRAFISPDLFARSVQAAGPALAAARPRTAAGPLVPPLQPRDEAIFWLTAAAEVEHFLMVHYLFAAYSIAPERAGDAADAARDLAATLVQIAREEMGHLITVQNLLTLVGAPLHFGREHSPFASEIYPFRFRLERASLGSLAKYVVAESPVDRAALEAGLLAEDVALYDGQIGPRALASNDGLPVRHVGPIFARLRTLFGDRLSDDDFRLDRAPRQARWSDWGYRTHPLGGDAPELDVLVKRFDQGDVAAVRAAAVEAVREIGDQGEEADIEVGAGESHFERFLAAWKALARIEGEIGVPPVWPVADNPNTALEPRTFDPSETVEAALEAPFAAGRIVNSRSRAWAELFDLRYRLLLRFVHHALLLEGPVFVEAGPAKGDRTVKGLLVLWAFGEMRRIAKIGRKLVRMPLGGDPAAHAGPPFELPYRLDLSPDEDDRWAGHADVLTAAGRLAGAIADIPADADDPFVAHLLAEDAASEALAARFAGGGDLPPAPGDFPKVAAILDEAVRGFDLGSHGAFWRDVTREAFLSRPVFGVPPVVAGDPEGSPLIGRIDLPEDAPMRMPRFRPRIADARIAYVREWIARGAPDGVPPGAIGIAREPDPKPEPATPRYGGRDRP